MPRTFDRWTPRNDKDPNRFGLDYTDPQGAIDESVTRSATRIRDNFPKIIEDTTGVDLTDKAQTRSVLGLAYGTIAGTVAQGNDSRIVGAEQATNRGVAGGYAPLNSLGKIDVTFLPASTANPILQYTSSAAFPATGDADTLYLAKDTGDLYSWASSSYARISERVSATGVTDSTATGRAVLTAADAAAARTAIGAGTSDLAIGTTSTTAKAGDYQPASTNISDSTTTGRALLTATDAAAARSTLSLNLVDNTSDAAKNVASAATLTTARTVQTNLASTSSVSFNGSANITPGVTGTLPVANGGTGAATLAANNVLLGNGTAELQAVAPGTSGNVLTSNGTTWSSTAPAVTLTNSVTLTNKTLTSPRISVINDANGNTGAWIGGTASAVNFLQLSNAPTGNRALLRAQGETNVGMGIAPRGTGTIALQDGNFAYIVDVFGVSSSVNYLNVCNGATGNAPYIQSTGTDTNVNLNLRTRGSGVVQLNGVSAVDISTAQVLTNKDLSSATNTFPTLNQNTTGSAAKWTTARALAGNSVDGSANVAFANKFVVGGTADSGLSGAQFLGALSTGIVKNTTSTGVLSIAAAGTDYLAPGGALGTPSSGTLTSCSGLPLSGLTSSTSTALGVGSLELGHASDTTLARSAAGVITVEGVELSRRTIQTVTGTTTLGSNGDYMVFIGASGAPTLPTAVGNTGRYTIKNIDTATRTVSTTSSQTIEGLTSYKLLANAAIDLFSDGSNWRIV